MEIGEEGRNLPLEWLLWNKFILFSFNLYKRIKLLASIESLLVNYGIDISHINGSLCQF
jgi:hypothetical protein